MKPIVRSLIQKKKNITYIKLVAVFVMGLTISIFVPHFSVLQNYDSNNEFNPIPDDMKVEVELEKTIDGDTAIFKVNGKSETFRFLSINTPELNEQKGEEAKDYVDTILKNSKNIFIEYDYKAKKDKYGRSLGWIWVDEVLLQEELVINGYAEVAYLYDDYKYNDLLQGLEEASK